MAYDTDGMIGKIALQKGLINPSQLKDCLGEQSAHRKAGHKRPLGVIMVARQLIKDEQLLDLLDEQKRYLAERANFTQVRKEDFLFGQILIKQGLVGPNDVNLALRAQAESAERGVIPVPRLGQILMDMGVSDEKLVQETLRIQYKTLYDCPGCGLKYNLVNARGDRQYRCRKCGELLAPTPAGTSIKADESAYGLKFEVSPDLPTEVAHAEQDPSNHFDKYILLEQIGRGGMGTVYRAYQKDLQRTVALKILRGGDEETYERFTREAQTAAKLRHPHIVSVYAIGRHHNVPFLVMEYVDGRPLDSMGKLPVRRTCAILRDIALAVHYAHQKGIIHRDLKPQNILVDHDGRAYVTDFGLAREISNSSRRLTLTGMIVGTPSYMSPEQARGARRMDGRTDVASLGCVLYELLTGVQPYIGVSQMDVALAVIHKDPISPRRINPALPPGLEAVCLKALEKDQDRRYATARALAEDLQRFLEGEAVWAQPPTHASRMMRTVRKNKLVAGLAAAALLAVALLLGLLGTSREDGKTVALLRRGQELERRGDFKEALRLYESDPSTAPEARRVRQALSGRTVPEKSREEERRRKVDEILALARLESDAAKRHAIADRAIALDPAHEGAYVLRAMARLELSDDASAYEDLGRAAELSEQPLPHFMARAEIARRLDWREKEIRDLARAIERNPLSSDLHLDRSLASAHLAAQVMKEDAPDTGARLATIVVEAEDDLAKAPRHPRLPEARAELDKVLEALRGSPPEVRRTLSRALTDRAYTLLFASQRGPGRAAARRAEELDPTFAPALAARGLGEYSSGNYRAARLDADRALELDPSLPEAFAVRGLARAVGSIAAMQAAAPGTLAVTSGKDGTSWIEDFVDGCTDLQEYLRHAPQRIEFRPLRRLATGLERNVPAAKAADGKTDVRQHLSEKLVARGADLRRRKDYACAVGLLSQALALHPENVRAFVERAEAHYLSRDYASAAADWERALKLDASLRGELAPRVRDALERARG